MTSFSLNTPMTSVNSILAIPSLSSYTKKSVSNKSSTTYTSVSKIWFQKASVKRFSIDWDLNMNELEFE